MRRILTAAGLVLAFSAWNAAPAAAADVIQVRIDKVAFAPVAVSARVGDTIEWVNDDFVAHTATARSKDWDVNILPGKSGRIVLKTSGTFAYYCKFHPGMTGTITVTK